MTALSFLPIAEEFARRGFATAVVLRRGYGTSGGQWIENYGTCDATHYDAAALAGSDDLHAAIQYLGTLRQFDTSKMIAVGVSAGGFATVALTAIHPPRGLLAAISFAGGRGSIASDQVCEEDSLVSVFAQFGKTSRTPMLWVYATNDHFFNPDLADRFYTAFTKQGGKVTFISPAPYGSEGHYLFSTAGIPKWTPIVDQFLKDQHLVFVNKLLPLPVSSLKPPTQLSDKAKAAFVAYIKGAPHKAFAASSDGSYAWRTGQASIEKAKQSALDNCQAYSSVTCKIIAVDDGMIK